MCRATRRHALFQSATPPGAGPGSAHPSPSKGRGVAGLFSRDETIGVQKTIPVRNSFAALCLHGRVPHWLNCCAIMNRRAGGGHVSEAQHSDSLVIGGFTP